MKRKRAVMRARSGVDVETRVGLSVAEISAVAWPRRRLLVGSGPKRCALHSSSMHSNERPYSHSRSLYHFTLHSADATCQGSEPWVLKIAVSKHHKNTGAAQVDSCEASPQGESRWKRTQLTIECRDILWVDLTAGCPHPVAACAVDSVFQLYSQLHMLCSSCLLYRR